MRKRILVVLLLVCALSLGAEQLQKEADEIALNIAAFIDTRLPVFLDIRCGEWTPALSQSLSQELLTKQADLREIRTHAVYEEGAALLESGLLANYGLTEANLVQVELNLKWQMIEHKSFFSYRTERRPIYSFVVKQLKLPQHQLMEVDTYDFSSGGSRDSNISAPRLSWFEPLIASTALASIIFLLWTIE
ncbi:MAG: hypothetical protein M0Q16_10555 [Candidatus Cloacimonetes bacterium]|jgi:hypothetical protein|nr:hypothetical protein [Candidatus Cloacimonadota bacterium]MCK9185797.1 hypothetical protein [Candidatus Cloacimonadota bacterium]